MSMIISLLNLQNFTLQFDSFPITYEHAHRIQTSSAFDLLQSVFFHFVKKKTQKNNL